MFLVAGCGGAQDAEETSSSKEVKGERGRKTSKDDVSEKGKRWGGWRWKGNRDDCFFKFENRCFSKRKTACKAAGCDLDACTDNGGAPVVVGCKND